MPNGGTATAAERGRGGLLIETAGPADQVVKLMSPLTISADELDLGLTCSPRR